MAKKPAKYRKIKADLQDQMERNQTHGEHFSDLLDDYMSFYETKNLLIQDIQNRGVTVEYNNVEDPRFPRNQSRPGSGW